MVKKSLRVNFYFIKAYRLSLLKMFSFMDLVFIFYSLLSIPISILLGVLLGESVKYLMIFNCMLFISLALSVFDIYKVEKSKYTNHNKMFFISSIIIQMTFYFGLWSTMKPFTLLSSILITVGLFFYLINIIYLVMWFSSYIFYLCLKINYPLDMKKFSKKESLTKLRMSRFMPIQDQVAFYIIRKFNGFLGGAIFLYVYVFIIAKFNKVIDDNFIYHFMKWLFNGTLLELGIFLAILSVVISILAITVPIMFKIENRAYQNYDKSKLNN